MFPRDVIELYTLWVLAIQNSRYVYGFPGRQDGVGTYTMDAGGGYIYVRIWRGQEITLDRALNMGGVPNPNVLVRMERRLAHVRRVPTRVRPQQRRGPLAGVRRR